MLPPESLEGRSEVGSVEDGEIAPADVLIAFVSPLSSPFFWLEIRGEVAVAFEASERFAIGMDLTNSVFVAPADRAVS